MTTPTPAQQAETVAAFEDALHIARITRGLSYLHMSMNAMQGELTIHVDDQQSAQWVAYLTHDGFRFDTGCAFRHASGHTAIEARRAANPVAERIAHRVTLVIVCKQVAPALEAA